MRKVKLYDTLFRCRYVLYAGDFDAEIEVPAYYIDWLMFGFCHEAAESEACLMCCGFLLWYTENRKSLCSCASLLSSH